jgi:hypothetical protein
VGRFDDRVLDATPSGLLRESAASSDEALRLALFTPSYAAPATSPHVYPVNGTPPADFKPRTIADLMPPTVFAAIDDWVLGHFPYLVQCAAEETAPDRGRVRPLVITQDMLLPEARGVVWKVTPQGLFPADFSELPHVQLRTKFLAEALEDYPDQQLVSFLTYGCSTQSEAAGLTMVLGPHLVSLAAGFVSVATNIEGMLLAEKYSIFRTSLSSHYRKALLRKALTTGGA